MAKQLLKERFQQLAGIKPLYEYEDEWSGSAADRATHIEKMKLDVSELMGITKILKKQGWEGPKDASQNMHAKIYRKESDNIYNLKINKIVENGEFSISIEIQDLNYQYNTELEDTLKDEISNLKLDSANSSELNDDFYRKLEEFLKLIK
tara:strand:+ start:52 stop:501 length:450 start_codon:yes stop_codon:yes gene_type:complete